VFFPVSFLVLSLIVHTENCTRRPHPHCSHHHAIATNKDTTTTIGRFLCVRNLETHFLITIISPHRPGVMQAMQAKAAAAGAAHMAKSALSSSAITLSALPSYVAAKAQAGPPPPPKPHELTPQELNLQRTARTLWAISFGLLWVGLTSHGWQRAQFQGTREVDGQTYHQTIEAGYGLRDVAYDLTTSHVTVGYASWNMAQEDDVLPYTLLLLVQCCMAVATVAGTGVFLAHIRAKCARTADGNSKYMRYSAYAAIPQCIFSALAVIAWKFIRSDAFHVFCTVDGCVKHTGQGLRDVGLYYAWVAVLSSAVLALFLALTLWRLVHYNDNNDAEEVEVQLVGGYNNHHLAGNVRNNSYRVSSSPGTNPLMMGAKLATPHSTRSPAETWNPQTHQAQYAMVGKGRSGSRDSAQPSWLVGV
jgi:uncharacterized membrane protein